MNILFGSGSYQKNVIILFNGYIAIFKSRCMVKPKAIIHDIQVDVLIFKNENLNYCSVNIAGRFQGNMRKVEKQTV